MIRARIQQLINLFTEPQVLFCGGILLKLALIVCGYWYITYAYGFELAIGIFMINYGMHWKFNVKGNYGKRRS